jgi:hypothetical protein
MKGAASTDMTLTTNDRFRGHFNLGGDRTMMDHRFDIVDKATFRNSMSRLS